MTAPPRLFDRALLLARRERAAASGFAGFLHGAVAHDMGERLGAVNRDFGLALDTSAGPGILGEALRATGKVERLIGMEASARLAASLPFPCVRGDEEALPFASERFDLVVSALSLQAVNDLPGALVQMRRALKPDGLFLAALFGAGTLGELRQAFLAAEEEASGGAGARVAPFMDVRDAGGLLQRAGFALPVADVDRLTVRYATPFHLFRDLRMMGLTNPLAQRERKPLSRAVLARAAALYAERFADADGRIRATFSIISLLGWAPHESQQKPLRPGSAKTRLADALGSGPSTGGR